MPRKARIEYPGAVYHVLNRGNYRTGLFSLEKTGESLAETLFQACSRFGWRLFASRGLSQGLSKTRNAAILQG